MPHHNVSRSYPRFISGEALGDSCLSRSGASAQEQQSATLVSQIPRHRAGKAAAAVDVGGVGEEKFGQKCFDQCQAGQTAHERTGCWAGARTRSSARRASGAALESTSSTIRAKFWSPPHRATAGVSGGAKRVNCHHLGQGAGPVVGDADLGGPARPCS
jgi:hypothetical protein